MKEFIDPSRMALVKDQRFRLTVKGEKVRAGRPVLVISTHGLSGGEREELRLRYLQSFAEGFISFPLKERARHLMTRVDSLVFNFGRWVVNWLPAFRRKSYFTPRSRTLEVMVKLEDGELLRLREYLRNIRKSRRRTIGSFRMEGQQFTEGRIDGNRALRGGHNCSSWIATAPLGEKGEALLELLGGERSQEIGTNPGWWTNWLAATAPAERVPFLLYWTPQPLDEALGRLKPGKNFQWDFYRR